MEFIERKKKCMAEYFDGSIVSATILKMKYDFITIQSNEDQIILSVFTGEKYINLYKKQYLIISPEICVVDKKTFEYEWKRKNIFSRR
jgi:hypothetical protein